MFGQLYVACDWKWLVEVFYGPVVWLLFGKSQSLFNVVICIGSLFRFVFYVCHVIVGVMFIYQEGNLQESSFADVCKLCFK